MRVLRVIAYLLGNAVALVAAAGLLARYVSPAVWWPPAIVALALPVLLLITFLFTAFALLRRRRWRYALLPAVVCLLAVPLVGRLVAFNFGAEPFKAKDTLRVITNNVRMFRNGGYEGVDAATVTRSLDKRRPDVLLLQEARHGGWRQNFVDDIKAASGLAKRHQLSEKTIATYADELAFVREDFSIGGGFNGFMVTDVATALDTLRVVNVHLESNGISGKIDDFGTESTGRELDRAERILRAYGASAAHRAAQAAAVRRVVRESPHPVIVGGDFNDVPSSYTYQHLLTPRLRDAWTERGRGLGSTFTGPLPALRIDFLLVDTALSVRSVALFDNGYSDHLGLEVVLSR